MIYIGAVGSIMVGLWPRRAAPLSLLRANEVTDGRGTAEMTRAELQVRAACWERAEQPSGEPRRDHANTMHEDGTNPMYAAV
ncbi:hypothetical protein PG985_010503 [Apiospora marii]|uniref:Uncharacterized protein n=1 Tax=Apiospora marii TaxID=335849 RepID=A0ABR1RZG3_9PEZI